MLPLKKNQFSVQFGNGQIYHSSQTFEHSPFLFLIRDLGCANSSSVNTFSVGASCWETLLIIFISSGSLNLRGPSCTSSAGFLHTPAAPLLIGSKSNAERNEPPVTLLMWNSRPSGLSGGTHSVWANVDLKQPPCLSGEAHGLLFRNSVASSAVSWEVVQLAPLYPSVLCQRAESWGQLLWVEPQPWQVGTWATGGASLCFVLDAPASVNLRPPGNWKYLYKSIYIVENAGDQKRKWKTSVTNCHRLTLSPPQKLALGV